MSEPVTYPAADLDLLVQQRGALPDAPLAMPTQRLEASVAGWRARISAILRRPQLPHGI